MKYLAWVLFYGLVVFLALNRHSKAKPFTYHSEIWADKAGYYVYLPAAFRYDFDARAIPDSLAKATGDGFRLNQATGKVETKYPYGVALLEAPFWAAAHAITTDKSGFSKAEHKAIDVAAATYFVLGLWLLAATLRRHFSGLVTALTVAVLVVGTNLWYYGIRETGMSHVFSFFAFALLLYLLTRREGPAWYEREASIGHVAAIATTVALISVLRPLNLVFAVPLLLWPVREGVSWLTQVRALVHGRVVGLLLVAGLVLWLPQLAYYHYLSGSWLVYSYGQEGFPNALAPKLIELWLAPRNGSFLYNPVLLLLLPGSLLLARTSSRRAVLALGLWAAASYFYAAWWDYGLGCAYAGRGFVELYPVLAWPIAAAVGYLLQRSRAVRWSAGSLLVLALAYNMRLSVRYDGCFYGTQEWDWAAYGKLLLN
ncbi:hypothetical protein K3G63_17180 [Hymenobacter sp. HSC-4F20]|uniref:hypothetical protein n=1 Tax=Hymenobacter sp. HSC-4F20 TaxID=2864135 RepID=UPI001C73726E|nr:hypothetical protein [Hymenobacter sp. HSC-4F20]MBX0292185.1 hypothetical protein [Hymenobacter sp. HSC-4F20]